MSEATELYCAAGRKWAKEQATQPELDRLTSSSKQEDFQDLIGSWRAWNAVAEIINPEMEASEFWESVLHDEKTKQWAGETLPLNTGEFVSEFVTGALNALHQESPFGVCPECGKEDGYLNIGRNHWLVCDAHKIKWCVGSNLFSCWREETPEQWEQNRQKLAGYREVEGRR